jgi:hypothetical protein
MSGGLMQLVALGAQDVYLTSNPSITFWKSVYRHHTNFAVESVENTFSGNATFGRKVTAVISRNGDLVTGMYLQVTLPATGADTSYVNNVALALIKSVEVEIGGQRIDKNYGEFMHMKNQLVLPEEKKRGYEMMTGGYGDISEATITDAVADYAGATKAINTVNQAAKTYYVPLQFWFCNGNPGSALPLIALQYHEVRVSFEFRPVAELVRAATPALPTEEMTASLFVDYVFLDAEERKMFSQSTHEYLITQTQFHGDETIAANTTNHKIRMNLNHPVKALYWTILDNDAATAQATTGNQWFDFGLDSDAERMTKATISLNGHERFAEREGSYFRLVQPYMHHTRVPAKQVYMYSFGLNPESPQPSGTCNFSRIDNSTLQFQTKTFDNDGATIKIFAENLNVLRVVSGMAGLSYSS